MSVVVVNPSSQPVPVTGSIAVSSGSVSVIGTVPVSLAAPVSISGTVPVSISAPVTVVLNETQPSPLFVSDCGVSMPGGGQCFGTAFILSQTLSANTPVIGTANMAVANIGYYAATINVATGTPVASNVLGSVVLSTGTAYTNTAGSGTYVDGYGTGAPNSYTPPVSFCSSPTVQTSTGVARGVLYVTSNVYLNISVTSNAVQTNFPIYITVSLIRIQ